MEVLQILVPLFTAMLGYAVGYWVKKAEYERQRGDELADRDFARRAAIHDRNIQEVRDYADTLNEICYARVRLITKLLELQPNNLTSGDIEWIQKQTAYLAELDGKLLKQVLSVYLLTDSRLYYLHGEVLEIVKSNESYLIEAKDTILDGKGDEVNMEKLLATRNRYADGQIWILELKTRIDELASELK